MNIWGGESWLILIFKCPKIDGDEIIEILLLDYM